MDVVSAHWITGLKQLVYRCDACGNLKSVDRVELTVKDRQRPLSTCTDCYDGSDVQKAYELAVAGCLARELESRAVLSDVHPAAQDLLWVHGIDVSAEMAAYEQEQLELSK